MTGNGSYMLTGQKILGYKLERRVGQGGMGEVYLGVHPALGQEVAVKVLDPILARDSELRERFIQEARIQIGLRHQGIVQVFTADTEGEHLALVMEYVEGFSLDELIRRRGPLPPAEATSLFGQVLDALDFAHRNGVVHRDIKPSNIMVQADGEVKIMDFGIAKVLGSTKLTQTGTAIGSAHYMSPEQVLGKEDIDHRTDIYSLGVSLYEALVGRPPFAEEGENTDSDYKIKDAQVRKEPPDPRELRADVPVEMAEAVLRAMAKDREIRWQSAAEMKDAMGRATAKASAAATRAKTMLWHGGPLESMEEDASEVAVSARMVPPTTMERAEKPPADAAEKKNRVVAPTIVEMPPSPAHTTSEAPFPSVLIKRTVAEVKESESPAEAPPAKVAFSGYSLKRTIGLVLVTFAAMLALGYYLYQSGESESAHTAAIAAPGDALDGIEDESTGKEAAVEPAVVEPAAVEPAAVEPAAVEPATGKEAAAQQAAEETAARKVTARKTAKKRAARKTQSKTTRQMWWACCLIRCAKVKGRAPGERCPDRAYGSDPDLILPPIKQCVEHCGPWPLM